MDYRSLIDPSWELTDPNPDVHAMFVQFNREFFWNQLGGVEVKWSKRMTLCAGLCRYTGRMGLCSIVLSEALLKLRPRKDLVETLLHEMIHAYLFVTDNFRDHDAHGPKFVSHMERINNLTGAHITIYHAFHQEVNHYKVHWWKCDGPCQYRPPFYGSVKRSMNRKPGPNDFWFAEHQRTCGGNFIKVKEPAPSESSKKKKSTAVKQKSSPAAATSSHKINEYFERTNVSSPSNSNLPSSSASSSATPSTSSNSRGTKKAQPKKASTSTTAGGVSKPKPPRKNSKKENNGKVSGTASNPIRNGGGTALGSGSHTTTTVITNGKNNNNSNSSSLFGATGQMNKPTNSSFVPFSGQGNVLGGGSSVPPYKRPRY